MTEPRTITLAGNPIIVPALPLRLNMIAYPLCRKLTNAGLADRYLEVVKATIEKRPSNGVNVSTEEMADLAQLAFIAAKAADPSLEREAFDEWPVTPPELLDAFFDIRYQTGGWVASSPGEGQPEPGEAKGAKKPRK